MFNGLITWRRKVASFSEALRQPLVQPTPIIIQIGYFIVFVFAKIFLSTTLFLLEIPLHLHYRTTELFTSAARRDERMMFVESYTGFVRRSKLSLATIALASVITVAQFTVAGYSIYRIGVPTEVQAYASSITLNPTYDIAAADVTHYYRDGSDCVIDYDEVVMDDASLNILKVGGQPINQDNCDNDPTNYYISALEFNLATIPAGATITNVQLSVNVSTPITAPVTIVKANSDAVSLNALGTIENTYWDVVEASHTYLTGQSWTTTGVKTYTLGSSAISDVQSRLTASKYISLGLLAPNAEQIGQFPSSESSTNKPQLIVTYSFPAQAPTNSSHGAITTSSITWTWTDNATADTSNVIHDAAHAVVCSTGAIAGTGSTGSCTESNLSPNTAYTRHPNVIDATSNTDGPSITAYTAIETPASILKSSASTTSITIHANGTLSHLGIGQSALDFVDVTTSTDSGWRTTDWTETGLTANTLHAFKVRARNGDGVVTSYTATGNISTLANPPSVTADEAVSTWYTSPNFTFSNTTVGGDIYYIWDKNNTATFPNPTRPTYVESPFDKTAATEGSWYLHVASYDQDNHPSGGTSNLGPFKYDGTPPTTPTDVRDGDGDDLSYSSDTTALSANWYDSTDEASGIAKYQFAIGTTSGGTDITNNGWLDGTSSPTASKDGLSLTNGTTYYFSVRAVDGAGNTSGVATSDGVTINTSLPKIIDNAPGISIPRKGITTKHDVDFVKAVTGPQLESAQYIVYSGPNKSGTLIKDWTDIFTTNMVSFTEGWSVDYDSLAEGLNYVSVKVQALDGLSSELDDAITINKDTTSPQITGFVAAPTTTTANLSWTTNEPSTTQVAYGTTSNYGSLSTLDSHLTTNHSVLITGLANNTTLHAQALGTDQAGNMAASADLKFVTQAGSHTSMTNIQAVNINTTTVTVSWLTNEPATSRVDFGTTTEYGLVVNDTTLVTSHSVTLTGLLSGQAYHYQVMSTGSTTDQDADSVFTTTVVPITEPVVAPPPSPTSVPSIIQVPAITNVHNNDLIADTTPTISGTGPLKSGIFIVVDRVLVQTVPVDAYGHFLVDLHKPLSIGTHSIVVRAKLKSGKVSDESQPISVSVVQPAAGTTIVSRTIHNGSTPSITFGLEAPKNSVVNIYIDATKVQSISVPDALRASQGFSVTVTPPALLAVGQHTISFVTYYRGVRPSLPTGTTVFSKTASTAVSSSSRLSFSTATDYVVQPHDSLWSIATAFLGDGRNWAKLRQVNLMSHPSLVFAPQNIYTGWTLAIPATQP